MSKSGDSMRYFDFINFWSDFFKWLFADDEERDYLKNVPKYCQQCELLGICRDKENNWKCHHGCMVLNAEREAKKRYEGK